MVMMTMAMMRVLIMTMITADSDCRISGVVCLEIWLICSSWYLCSARRMANDDLLLFVQSNFLLTLNICTLPDSIFNRYYCTTIWIHGIIISIGICIIGFFAAANLTAAVSMRVGRGCAGRNKLHVIVAFRFHILWFNTRLWVPRW